MNEVFSHREGEWQVRLGNKVLPHVWNNKGAALAGMQTELRRAENIKLLARAVKQTQERGPL